LLHDRTIHPGLGAAYFHERERQDVERRLVGRLEALGDAVTLRPTDQAA
jgi:hypothetical protein